MYPVHELLPGNATDNIYVNDDQMFLLKYNLPNMNKGIQYFWPHKLILMLPSVPL